MAPVDKLAKNCTVIDIYAKIFHETRTCEEGGKAICFGQRVRAKEYKSKVENSQNLLHLVKGIRKRVWTFVLLRNHLVQIKKNNMMYLYLEYRLK